MFLFSSNDDFFRGKILDQDPVYTTQVHATYNLGRGIWAALSGTYDYGGRKTIDDVPNDDIEENSRIGATLALPVNRNNSVKLFASTPMYISAGGDYHLAGIIWQYRWGGEL